MDNKILLVIYSLFCDPPKNPKTILQIIECNQC